MPIQLLPPQLANQIAAGEVVERPASVVKELIENSLDAGASKIELDIEKGGHKRIRLRDNGSGIGKDELTLALSRHATSKITSLDDLEQILSLGFRGEALASISSVSRLTLTSKTAGQEQAWQAHCEGREMEVKVNPAAHPDGTTIDVVDLFYNTPARRKFLRTEKTEFQHIDDVFRRIALSHPSVSFILKHNGKVVRRYMVSGADPLSQRIGAVMGQKFINSAVHVVTETHGMKIEAWLGDESALRSSSDCQFSFVNGRGMRDKLILHAIRQAYESVWGVLEQPSFVVYLTVPPKEVDVNVHPAKHEVRFQQSRLVHDFICKAVADALSEGNEQENGHYSQPAHDYIRPLMQETSKPGSDDSPEFSNSGNYQPASRNTAQKNSSARSPTPGLPTRSSPGIVAEHYSALMTTERCDLTTTEVQYLEINEYVRLYRHKNACWLFDITSILSEWVCKQLLRASTSQPLLMPVSVMAGVSGDKVADLLTQHHFAVKKVAGKYLLQQVPAGCRHFPWVKWFPEMLSSGQKTLQGVVSSIPTNAELPSDIRGALWNDLEQYSQRDLLATLAQFGQEKPVDAILNSWEQL